MEISPDFSGWNPTSYKIQYDVIAYESTGKPYQRAFRGVTGSVIVFIFKFMLKLYVLF
jgi:hypothetical protein